MGRLRFGFLQVPKQRTTDALPKALFGKFFNVRQNYNRARPRKDIYRSKRLRTGMCHPTHALYLLQIGFSSIVGFVGVHTNAALQYQL
jgi:hypothetical protein